MDWLQVFVIIFGNAAWILPMFFWNRTESRADVRHIENLVRIIQEEIKDFHGRLVAIEERRSEEKAKLILEELRKR